MSSRKPAAKSKTTSRSSKAGLQFPVGRIHRHLREGRYAKRIGADAPVYLASVIEYLTAEILELAGTAALDNKKQRVSPRHIQLAVRNDQELTAMLSQAIVRQGGVLPGILKPLLPKKAKTKTKTPAPAAPSDEDDLDFESS